MKIPNIVFVICDDLGVNDLHCYGRYDHNTPHLDKLAAEEHVSLLLTPLRQYVPHREQVC